MEASLCPWYKEAESIDAPLLQGELVYSCPILVPSKNNYDQIDDPPVFVDDYDVIIMSQSCDLDPKQCQLEQVVVSAFDSPPAYFSKPEYKNMFNSGWMEGLRTGRKFDFCLLNKCPGSDFFPADYLIVDFCNVFSVPHEVVLRAAKKGRRIQLQSPYREYLSQAFARFFMRVGFPDEGEIPKFTETWPELESPWKKAIEELKSAEITNRGP